MTASADAPSSRSGRTPVRREIPTAPTVLRVEDLHKAYGATRAVDGVRLDLRGSECLALLGPSGCGKSTLLRIIAGLERPDHGAVRLDGEDLAHRPPQARRFGMVFQSYALFPNLTALDNVAFGSRGRGLSRAEARRRAAELLRKAGILECAERFPGQLSGGQQQRVALARALAIEPRLLLLDEPLSALDARVRERLRGELRAMQQREAIPAILVTHDQEEAFSIADRVAVMARGRVLQCDAPERLYRQPATLEVAGFVGEMNLLRGWTVAGERRVVRGATSLPVGRSLGGSDESASLTVGFRPEHATLRPSGADAARLDATVVAVEFRGAGRRLRLRVDDSGESIAVDAPADDEAPAAGQSVAVRVPASCLLLFGRDGQAR